MYIFTRMHVQVSGRARKSSSVRIQWILSFLSVFVMELWIASAEMMKTTLQLVVSSSSSSSSSSIL